jgi:hypothetical protein
MEQYTFFHEYLHDGNLLNCKYHVAYDAGIQK